jgi:hypothetical protein
MKKNAITLSPAQNIARKLSEKALDGEADNAKGRLKIPSRNGISAPTDENIRGRAISGLRESRFFKV